MTHKKRVAAILLMGGSGRRFGSEQPKQFHRLAGKSIYLHTLEVFHQSTLFDEIVLCCHPDWMGAIERPLPDRVKIAKAGSTRQESSYLGLLSLNPAPDIVVIHDAVRPFVSKEILLENISMALLHGAVDTCVPSTDTIVHAPNNCMISTIPPRREFLRGQTPQSFSYSIILDAHQKTAQKDATDDCQLVLERGHRIAIAKGSELNLKITSELDLLLAEHLFRLKKSSRPFSSRKTLSNRRYAIVGGTGGIGQAIRDKLHLLGIKPILLSRKTHPTFDLSDPSSILQAFSWIEKTGGPLDGLINCAGKLLSKPLTDLNSHEIDEMLTVNLKGLILSCKNAPLKKGAHVINIASSSYTRGRKEICVYSSTKAAVVNFTQGWADERPDLRVHAIIPGRTNTPMRRENFPMEDVSTLLDPKEVADAVISLLKDPDSTGLLVEVKHLMPAHAESVFE